MNKKLMVAFFATVLTAGMALAFDPPQTQQQSGWGQCGQGQQCPGGGQGGGMKGKRSGPQDGSGPIHPPGTGGGNGGGQRKGRR